LTPLEAPHEVSVGGAIDTVRILFRAHVGVAGKESVELPPSSSLDDALFVFRSPEPPSLPSSVYLNHTSNGVRTVSGHLRHLRFPCQSHAVFQELQLRSAASGSGRLKPRAGEVVGWRHKILHHEDTSIFFLNLTGILGDGRRCQVFGIRLLFGTTRHDCLCLCLGLPCLNARGLSSSDQLQYFSNLGSCSRF
jgi:hypothetical protein